MIKMEMNQGQITQFEMSGKGAEVAADICVMLKRCADEFVRQFNIDEFVNYMVAMEATLNETMFKMVFGIDPPSKYKAGSSQDYKVEGNDDEG